MIFTLFSHRSNIFHLICLPVEEILSILPLSIFSHDQLTRALSQLDYLSQDVYQEYLLTERSWLQLPSPGLQYLET